MATVSQERIPILRKTLGSVVVPGDRICRLTSVSNSDSSEQIRCIPGPGTYAKGGEIWASLVGSLYTSSIGKDVLIAVRSKQQLASDTVVRVSQIVLARVQRLATQQVMVDIVATPHGRVFHAEGCIRKADVRAGVQTSLEHTGSVLLDSFRPGDWVVARVLSLGDARRYFLGTAEPSLGVVYALSRDGHPMVPISHREMECSVSNTRELRKTARPVA